MRDGWAQHFGYGPWFRVADDGEVVFLQKDGINAGTSCVLRHYPGRELTLVILHPLGVVHEMVTAGAFG